MSIADITGVDGTIVGLAVDHRDSFRAALRERGLADDDGTIRAIKVDVCNALLADASFLLVDDDFLAWTAQDSGIAVHYGFALPLEAQGYGDLHAVERTTLLDSPTIAEMAAEGARALKLLLPYRPDVVDRAQDQRTIAAAAIAMCHAEGLPLILEPIVWRAPGEERGGADELSDERFAELVVAAARELAPLQPGLLKLQYPGSRDACVELHAACGGHPWVLLGGGAPLADLERHVADACDAGALGCIVGRSLFDGALVTDPAVRAAYLSDVARPALRRLARIVREHVRVHR